MPIWLAKFIATKIYKAIKHNRELKKIDEYVNKPNKLDKQMKQIQKIVNKYGKYIEELEKEVAMLNKDTHPPIFSISDYKDILKRLRKLENAK